MEKDPFEIIVFSSSLSQHWINKYVLTPIEIYLFMSLMLEKRPLDCLKDNKFVPTIPDYRLSIKPCSSLTQLLVNRRWDCNTIAISSLSHLHTIIDFFSLLFSLHLNSPGHPPTHTHTHIHSWAPKSIIQLQWYLTFASWMPFENCVTAVNCRVI